MMRKKPGINILPAMIAFPIALALLREFDFESFTFKKQALGILYLITFVVLVFLTFKKRKLTEESDNQAP